MSDEWYPDWVRLHCVATAADASAAKALLSEPVRFVLLAHGGATAEELGEVTVRLVASGVPKFANEHSDAVGRELNELRVERARGNVSHAPGDDPPDCPACGGTGFAVVPVRKCVWQGRLVLHPDSRRVVTGAVLCDRPGCEAGRVARQKELALPAERRRATLDRAERAAGCDLVALLRAWEREQARLARGDGPGEFAADLRHALAAVRARRGPNAGPGGSEAA